MLTDLIIIGLLGAYSVYGLHAAQKHRIRQIQRPARCALRSLRITICCSVSRRRRCLTRLSVTKRMDGSRPTPKPIRRGATAFEACVLRCSFHKSGSARKSKTPHSNNNNNSSSSSSGSSSSSSGGGGSSSSNNSTSSRGRIRRREVVGLASTENQGMTTPPCCLLRGLL